MKVKLTGRKANLDPIWTPVSEGESPVRSGAVLERIRALQIECENIEAELVSHGQFVASAGMDDAIGGLRRTAGLWNDRIVW